MRLRSKPPSVSRTRCYTHSPRTGHDVAPPGTRAIRCHEADDLRSVGELLLSGAGGEHLLDPLTGQVPAAFDQPKQACDPERKARAALDDSAVSRFRESVADFRSNGHDEGRFDNLKEQTMTLRRRCRLMPWATLVGLSAAILLMTSLILAGLDVIIPHTPWVAVTGIAALLLGFALVITAAMIVIVEGRIVGRQLENELRDVPDLAREAGLEPGSVRQNAG